MANLQDGNTLVGSLSGLGSLDGSLTIPSTIEGTRDYERLYNQPSIESVTLIGNKDFVDLGLSALDADDLLEILV